MAAQAAIHASFNRLSWWVEQRLCILFTTPLMSKWRELAWMAACAAMTD